MKLILIASVLWLGVLGPGTADVGLASAGHNARAQDAPTVFTNPAGMTRLEGRQSLAAGQLDYGRTKFSIGSGSSSALDTNLQSMLPVALGGRGNVVGLYDDISTLFLGLYGNWKSDQLENKTLAVVN